MDDKDLDNFIDHQRWLINNGLVLPVVQDNLFMYGVLAHPEVKEVDVELDALGKKIKYTLFFEPKMLKVFGAFERLSSDSSLWGVFRLWLLLKKHGNLDLRRPLLKMVEDYCGSKWAVDLQIVDVANYKKDFNGSWNPTMEKAKLKK